MTETNPQESRKVADVLKDAWSQALLAVDAAEEEAQKLLSRLSGLVEVAPQDARKVANDFAERLAKQRAAIEHGLEEGVKKALNRFRIPSKEDVEALSARVEKLDAKVRDLLDKRS